MTIMLGTLDLTAHTGLWADSCRGIYAVPWMLRCASDLGFPMDEEERGCVLAYEANAGIMFANGEEYAPEDVTGFLLDQGGIADRAETWLNENTTGGVWYWYDGDFRLDEECPNDWADCEDEECWQHSDL